ncbi:MAG: hypothetical protein A3K77_08525, partial [Euryarchaeota archaeon RBG_13_31_8]
RIRIILVCILFLGTCAVPFSVRSDIVMINGNNLGITNTITLYPLEDTRVNQHNPSVNYGLSGLVISNMYGATSDYEQDILIKFDLSSIPSSASIISASLHLYYYDYWDTNPVGRPINCYRITSSWNEMSVTWNTRPSYYNSVTSTTYVPFTWGWMSWNVKNDVISFISGSTTNYGWQLMDETYWGGNNIPQQLYKSREENPKPYLEIEIEGNNPPNKPSKPSGPASGYIDTLLTFSTTATDPDNDQIKYGWDWNGDNGVDEWSGLMASGNTCYKTHQWDNPGTYNIKVKAKDSKGADSIWSDVKTLDILVENQPPNTPSNPDPSNHALDIDIYIDLSWGGGDPDADDTVTYDVYFGNIQPLPKVASNITTTVFDP